MAAPAQGSGLYETNWPQVASTAVLQERVMEQEKKVSDVG